MRTQRSVFVFLVSLHALPILPDFYTECTYFFTAVRKPSEKKKLSETTPVKAGFLASESLCFKTSPSVTSNVISAYPSAMMAGMKEYDVIVKLGEQKVETIKQYHEQLGKHSAGEVVTVTAMRKGAEGYAEMTFDVTLGEV